MLCISIIDISEGPGTPIFGVENEVRKFNQRVDNNSQVVWCYSQTEHKRFSLKCDMDQLSDCQLSKAHWINIALSSQLGSNLVTEERLCFAYNECQTA